MSTSPTADLRSRSELLRSLHKPGAPLLLPNAWDVATTRAVVAAGFPVVATTSGGVAGTLGYQDHEGAPGEEMLAAAARIARGVEVPAAVDAEAGYGMAPSELVAALRSVALVGEIAWDTRKREDVLVAEVDGGLLSAIASATARRRTPGPRPERQSRWHGPRCLVAHWS